MRIDIFRVSRQRSVVEVMHALPDVGFLGIEIIEWQAVVRVVPTVARLYSLIPIRRRCWGVST